MEANQNITGVQVSRKEYVQTLFPGYDPESELIALGEEITTRDGKKAWPMRPFHPRQRRNLDRATHVPMMTVDKDVTNPSGNPIRSMDTFVRVHNIQLDDAGSKGNKLPALAPTAKIQTRPPVGDEDPVFTFVYVLDVPCDDLDKFSNVLKNLAAAGYMDKGAAKATQLNRLPDSLPEGKEHRAVLASWHPERRFNLDTFLEDMNIQEQALHDLYTGPGKSVPAPPGVTVEDEVYEWLVANGHITGERRPGRYQVTCPRAHEHSTDDGASEYRKADETHVIRSFGCYHSHDITTTEFLQWVKEQGGPDATPNALVSQEHDMEELAQIIEAAPDYETVNAPGPEADTTEQENVLNYALQRLVWYEPKAQIIDLETEHLPLMVPAGVAPVWAEHDQFTARGRRISFINEIWKLHPGKQVTRMVPHLNPHLPFGFADGIVNTYRPFEPLADPKDAKWHCQMFLTLIRHVFPDDSEWVLDWLACKVTRPWERMTALVSYTPQFGTGRNTVFHIARMLLGERYCTTMQASRLFGAQSNQFNAHMDNLLITIGEVEEGNQDPENRRVSAATFNRLKELVDPDERAVRLERKGVDGMDIETFASFMIATNAGAGLPLEEGDRRFSVLRGNMEKLRDVHPDLVHWIKTVRDDKNMDALSAIHHMLAARDLSAFEPAVPHHTSAKDDMIEDGKSELDRAIEDTLDILGNPPVVAAAVLADAMQSSGMQAKDARIYKLAQPYGEGKMVQIVSAWLRKHSAVPSWITSKKKQLRVNYVIYYPRVMQGDTSEGKVGDTKRFEVFLENVERLKANKFTLPEYIKGVHQGDKKGVGDTEGDT